MHVYELMCGELVLIGRLCLPVCKHRWLTSFAVIATKPDADENIEIVHIATGTIKYKI